MERLDSWIRSIGPWGYLILGVAAFIEYVFPPFPGDSVMLLGGLYVARGQRPWPLVLLALTLGSVAGAAADFWIGGRLARRLERVKEGESALPRRLQRLYQVQDQMQRRGTWLLLVNRFLPGIRALIFVAAGAARLPLARVLILGTASALAFNSLVLGVGVLVGGNAEQLATLVARYQRAVSFLVVAAVLGLVVRWLATRHART